MIDSRVLRVTAFADHWNVGHVEVVAICEDGVHRVIRISFVDPVQLSEAAEKMQLVSEAMARFAPRKESA